MGSQRVGHNWSTFTFGNLRGALLNGFCPERNVGSSFCPGQEVLGVHNLQPEPQGLVRGIWKRALHDQDSSQPTEGDLPSTVGTRPSTSAKQSQEEPWGSSLPLHSMRECTSPHSTWSTIEWTCFGWLQSVTPSLQNTGINNQSLGWLRTYLLTLGLYQNNQP